MYTLLSASKSRTCVPSVSLREYLISSFSYSITFIDHSSSTNFPSPPLHPLSGIDVRPHTTLSDSTPRKRSAPHEVHNPSSLRELYVSTTIVPSSEDVSNLVNLDAIGISGVPTHPHSSLRHDNISSSIQGSSHDALKPGIHSETLIANENNTNLVEFPAPSDSGYGSTSHPRLESSIVQAVTHSNHPEKGEEPQLVTSRGSRTVYSSAESIQGSELARYVTEFAEELSGMFPTSLPSAELSHLESTLPNLLKAFAIKLGFCDTSPIAKTLMYLVHRYRQ